MVALGFAFYLVRGFLRDHPEVGQALASIRLVHWLRSLLGALLSRFTALRPVVRRRARWEGEAAEDVGEKGSAARPGQPARRTDRGRILHYYLDVVRRARRAGVARRPWQTPDEYGLVLRAALPGDDLPQDMDLLTEAFVEARYSRHPIQTGLAHRVRVSWQRVKQALSFLRKRASVSEEREIL
jgi:hypothetical protein